MLKPHCKALFLVVKHITLNCKAIYAVRRYAKL